MVQRPDNVTPGTPAGDARAAVVTGLSLRAAAGAAGTQIEPHACLMSDEATAFIALGENYASHDTVKHSSREYVRDPVHVNSVEGFNSRVRRTIAGLPLVTAHCYRPGCAEKPKWLGTRENPVVAGAAGAAIAASLSRGYRPPNAQEPGWWDHRQISSRCLWLIKAMYRVERHREPAVCCDTQASQQAQNLTSVLRPLRGNDVAYCAASGA